MRRSVLLLVALVAACTRGAPPAAPLPAPNPSMSTFNPELLFCVVRNGRLEQVVVHVLSFSGDTVTDTGVPISRAFPADSTYALNAAWYANSWITVADGLYVQYG